MHVACVSYYYEPKHATPEALLDSYPTVVDWADAVSSAGASVTVVHRFAYDAEIARRDVFYRFVSGKPMGYGPSPERAANVNAAVVCLRPDVIHVNGLAFAPQAWWLKRLAPRIPIIVQDHANAPCQFGRRAALLRLAFRHIDAVSFAAPELAEAWRRTGYLPRKTTVFSLMESSSRFELLPRATARARTRLGGNPLCLWVGRLNTNKDPITVLEGFSKAAAFMDDPHLALVYGEAHLLPAVQAWLSRHRELAARVTLLGRVPHAALEAYYNSADIFVLGSHREGSGYSLMEAMSCGVTPVVTDIPSFRMLAGAEQVGALWAAGDSDHLAVSLAATSKRLGPATRSRVRAHFEAHWSMRALGQNAVAIYRSLAESTAESGAS